MKIRKKKTSVSIDMNLAEFIESKKKERIFSSTSHAVNFALRKLKKNYEIKEKREVSPSRQDR